MVNAFSLVAWQRQAGHETRMHLEPNRGGSLFTMFSKSHHVTRAFRKAFLIAPVFSLRNMRRKLRLVIGIHKGGCFFLLLSVSVFVWFLCVSMHERGKDCRACGLKKKKHKPALMLCLSWSKAASFFFKQTFLVGTSFSLLKHAGTNVLKQLWLPGSLTKKSIYKHDLSD